jgi:hypothetical protein
MTNPFILKVWVKTKIKDLERDSQVCNTVDDLNKIQGKIEILKEFYEDFNLESIDEKEILIHNNF